MTRFAPSFMAVLLCGGALMGCSSPDSSLAPAPKAQASAASQALPTDLTSGIRQAQLLRQAGHYDEAVHMLSQLMLVASDDARVVGEYGKTLAEMGRAQDATQFLTRAVELQGNDWTLYSAMGVAYDQIGDQNSARAAYEHALALKPSEPSVINNYALSRMLAGDPQGARQLIDRIRASGGGGDPKIARNIALLDQLAPAGKSPQVAAKAAPAKPAVAAVKPAPAELAPKVAVAMPRALQAVHSQPLPQAAPSVVMQAVPADPLAGPVKPKPVARAQKPVVIPPKSDKPLVIPAKADKPVAVAATIEKVVVTPSKFHKPAALPAKIEKAVSEPPALKGPAKAAEAKTETPVPSLRMASGGC